MATDNEQLVLSISADTRQILRQLKGLVGQTQRDTKAITDLFGNVDKAASGAFDGVAANSNRAFTTAVNGGRRYQEAMKASTVQTSNLAAQLNDIGVQLAGGQSPFLIALQQGTQITQALGSGAGARGAVSALAGAFTSLLNPVSLATIGIIALGGSAVQYFTSLLSDGEQSAETLQKQGQLIQQLARDWGDAVPALREYANELERTQQLAELRQGAEIVNADTLEKTRADIDDIKVALAEVDAQLRGQDPDIILAFQSAFKDFASAAEDGSLEVEDVKRVQDALADAIASTGIPVLSDFARQFDALAASALNAAGSVQETNAQIQQAMANAANYPGRGTYPGVFRSSDFSMRGEDYPLPESGPTPESRPLIELTGLPKARGGGGGRSKAISDAEREKKAVADLIEQLEFEQSILGATDVEREVANALRRAGAAATDEQRAKIEQLVEATYAEREALKANKDAMQELQNVAKDVLGGIISDLRAGKSGADILANALDRVLSKLIDGALDSFINNIFGGLGGGRGGLLGGFIIPGILHSGGVAGRDGYGHGRAVSPSVFSGAKRYHTGGVAGLKPGEVPAILQRGEVVIPRGGKMRSGAETITVNLAADRSVIAETADQRIETASGTIVNVAVQQANQRVVPTMARYQSDKAGAEWR